MSTMPQLQTALTERLGLRVPIVLAPMGGGPGTVELAVAVCTAGGLGSLAGGYLPADALQGQMHALRRAFDGPFNVNVFADKPPDVDGHVIEQARRSLVPHRRSLGLPQYIDVSSGREVLLSEQVEVLAEDPPAVVSFTFGLPDAAVVERLHAAGCLLMATATTVNEALAVEAAGVDLVCVQGFEAGAHRGTFLEDPFSSLVGLIALAPQVRDAVSVPVIATGGIMDGRGLTAALALGADAVQMGTAFLRCPEAGTTPPHRRALAAATDTSTVLTDKITGRLARGIRNALIDALSDQPVPPYPVMHALTAELRREATAQDRPDLMSLWAGQGAPLATDLPASALVARIAEEAAGVLQRLNKPTETAT